MSRLVEPVTLELGDLGPRQLRLTLYESWQFAERCGKSFVRDGINLLDLDEREFATLVWACLQDRGDLTPEDVARHLDAETFVPAFAAVEGLIAGFYRFMREPEVPQPDPPKNRAARRSRSRPTK